MKKFKKLKSDQKIQNFKKNLKKSLKFTFFFQKKRVVKKITKKCYPLRFPILGGHDSTRALQASPFQKYKNLKNLKKSLVSKK